MHEKRLFQIEHTPTGKFKSVGFNPCFSRVGKLWKGGAVKKHLRLYDRGGVYREVSLIDAINNEWKINGFSTTDCELVEYRLVEITRTPLEEFIKNEMEKHEKGT